MPYFNMVAGGLNIYHNTLTLSLDLFGLCSLKHGHLAQAVSVMSLGQNEQQVKASFSVRYTTFLNFS